MQVHERVPLDQPYIAAFCRRHRIRRLSLFGSMLRDDFDPETSDIDFRSSSIRMLACRCSTWAG